MKNILIVVDMQKDFVDGALGTKEAVAIVPAAAKKIAAFDGEIIATIDTHFADYMDRAKSCPYRTVSRARTAGSLTLTSRRRSAKRAIRLSSSTPSARRTCRHLSGRSRTANRSASS